MSELTGVGDDDEIKSPVALAFRTPVQPAPDGDRKNHRAFAFYGQSGGHTDATASGFG